MSASVISVKDAAGFLRAVQDSAKTINVEGTIGDLSSVKLPAGTRLHGAGGKAELHFKAGQPGLMLSADHQVSSVRLVTDEAQVALGLSDDADDLGTLEISDVRTVGRFHLEGSMAKTGHLKLNDIHVERADARMAAHRPAGFGVEVLLWPDRHFVPDAVRDYCMFVVASSAGGGAMVTGAGGRYPRAECGLFVL